MDNDHNEAQFTALTLKATAGTPNTPNKCFMQDFLIPIINIITKDTAWEQGQP